MILNPKVVWIYCREKQHLILCITYLSLQMATFGLTLTIEGGMIQRGVLCIWFFSLEVVSLILIKTSVATALIINIVVKLTLEADFSEKRLACI